MGSCSQSCTIANSFCFGPVCGLIQQNCEAACGGACTCSSTCLNNCLTARSNCIGDNNSLVRAGTCSGSAVFCVAGCPLQCGVQVPTPALQVLSQQANAILSPAPAE